jgi:hypothetical protein
VKKLAVQQLESPSLALRYGLLSIKPIPVEEIVKIKGQKYVKKGISFLPDEEKKTELEKFEDFINFRYGQIFEKMPCPKQFDPEQVINHFINNAIENVKKDKDFVDHLEQKKRSLYSYVTFITDRFEERIPSLFQSEADNFLNSNLPLTFSIQSSMFINTYQKYLHLVKRVVRRFEILTHLPGVRDKFRTTNAELTTMQKELAPIIDKMDMCSIEYMTLNLYMLIWSASKFEEIDGPIFVDANKFEDAYFKEYCLRYDTELKTTRKLLFEVSKKFEPELFDLKQAPETSTTLMLGKLLSSVQIDR